MTRTDRICVWIMIAGLALLVPSYQYAKFCDELCSMALLGVAALDCVVNGNWRRYRLLFLIIAVMTFYAAYSVLFRHYNTPAYILVDWIIEIKPYIPFCVFLAVRPRLTNVEKQLIKFVSIVNAVAVCIILACGETVVETALHHITYVGLTLFVSAMMILYCSMKEDGSVDLRSIALTLLILTAGLATTRAKYYGIYVLSLFFLTAYRPGMMRSLNAWKVAGAIALLGAVIAVSWSKIDFYYLSGGSDKFDRSVAESFARPVLYATAGLILIQQFPFGSGLASIATYASQQNYSTLYYEYGIDKVYGLSPQTGYFICDAFFPSLAQFGVIGVALYAAFWAFVYSYIRKMIRSGYKCFRYPVAIGILIILHIFIESTSGNTFTQPSGMMVLCLLGIICGNAADIKEISSDEEPIGQTTEEFQLRKI